MRTKFLISPFRARLSRHIALWVFGSILLIEAIIVIPSWQKRERDLLKDLEDNSLASLSPWASLVAAEDDNVDLDFVEDNIALSPLIKGARIYRENGKIITQFGEIPGLTFTQSREAEILRKRSSGQPFYDVAWSASALGEDYTLIARLDASNVDAGVADYFWRMLFFVLIICLFVTSATMLALGPAVIKPILRLRDDLLMAGEKVVGEDKSLVDLYSLSVKRKDELGEVMSAFNTMLSQVSRSITQLKDQEIFLLEKREKELAESRDMALAAAQRSCLSSGSSSKSGLARTASKVDATLPTLSSSPSSCTSITRLRASPESSPKKARSLLS